MRDLNFEGLESRPAYLEKPVVATDAERGVSSPTYERAATVRAVVQPLVASSSAGLLGRFPEGTDVAYIAGTEPAMEPGDVLAVVAGASGSTGDGEAGEGDQEVERYEVLGAADEAGLGHHRKVVMRRVWV
jgi:hypothetical protein